MAADSTTESQPQRRFAKRLTGDVRSRILLSYVVLLAMAGLASVLVVRHVLLVRLNDRVQDDLAQEVREFRSLAGGADPETGQRFGTHTNRIFDVYLDRNVPGEGEQLLTVPRRGKPLYRASERANILLPSDDVARWRRLDSSEHGELETPLGEARYLAVPLASGGESLGTFVVAYFVAGERAEVNEAVRIVAGAAAGILLLGTAVAFFTAGRVLAPLSDLRDAARSISGADMTRRIAAEDEGEIADLGRTFNLMLDRLELAFGSQREFIRDASHELRTPIAVVRGHLELLGEADPTDRAERDATLRLVTGELDRMTRFVEDLLLLAKAESPSFLELETVQVGELCEELITKGRSIASRNWQLDSVPRRSVVADRQRLTQAVMNLARNAVEHTADGDPIAIGGSVDGHEAAIWVRDSGAGIQPEDQARIFERFARGRQSRTRYEGSGLGLAIVRTIAEAHGGRIELRSQPGEGARFTISIPVEGPGETQATSEEVGR